MAAPILHRWTLTEFLHAWEAGAFESRVELVEGEVWAVSTGDWHGDTSMRVARALPNGSFRITSASLATGDSLPDPDCSVRRRDAQPVAQLSRRVSRWAAEDILLVVEVSDETRDYDLGIKAALYARAGYHHYWVVTPDGVYDHAEPGPAGYARRVVFPPGALIPVPYVDGAALAVDDLIAD